MTRNLAIFLFEAVEVLDFAGPYEVFSVAGLRTMPQKPFNVYTVAEKSPVVARNGLTIIPDFSLDNCPPARHFFGARRRWHHARR